MASYDPIHSSQRNRQLLVTRRPPRRAGSRTPRSDCRRAASAAKSRTGTGEAPSSRSLRPSRPLPRLMLRSCRVGRGRRREPGPGVAFVTPGSAACRVRGEGTVCARRDGPSPTPPGATSETAPSALRCRAHWPGREPGAVCRDRTKAAASARPGCPALVMTLLSR